MKIARKAAVLRAIASDGTLNAQEIRNLLWEQNGLSREARLRWIRLLARAPVTP